MLKEIKAARKGSIISEEENENDDYPIDNIAKQDSMKELKLGIAKSTSYANKALEVNNRSKFDRTGSGQIVSKNNI